MLTILLLVILGFFGLCILNRIANAIDDLLTPPDRYEAPKGPYRGWEEK